MSHRTQRSLVLVILLASVGFAQADKNSASDQKQTIRVGVAATMNRSNSQIDPTWERDQLVRELQRLRKDRKSTILLEAIPLDAAEREDASAEAEKKDCQYFVLTTLLNPSRGPGISGGPDGSQRAPVLLGNTSPGKTLAMNFAVVEVGMARTVAEGTSTAPVEDKNDIRAADDAMRFVAHRVASELRSRDTPRIE
ncbi:MAG TPA: hypothetical protein VMP68_21825 [Candidatus Eisenbacteria bacterium]|nr:hypothetical protein [Candidatus Eisenbacteria bacterium]